MTESTRFTTELDAIRDRIATGYGRSLDIGPGWYPIVIKLDQDIAAIHPDYKVHQVKEKFGGLRYYCEWDGDPQVETLIRAAEEEAWTTCESCGTKENVTTDGTGWITSRCTECHNKPTHLGQF